MTNRPTRLNAVLFAVLTRILYERGASCAELAEETGLHVCTIRHYVRAMRKQRLLRIHAYQLDANGRRTIAVYSFAPGVPDVARPGAMTGAERMRVLRERQQASRQRKQNLQLTHLTAGQAVPTT